MSYKEHLLLLDNLSAVLDVSGFSQTDRAPISSAITESLKPHSPPLALSPTVHEIWSPLPETHLIDAGAAEASPYHPANSVEALSGSGIISASSAETTAAPARIDAPWALIAQAVRMGAYAYPDDTELLIPNFNDLSFRLSSYSALSVLEIFSKPGYFSSYSINLDGFAVKDVENKRILISFRGTDDKPGEVFLDAKIWLEIKTNGFSDTLKSYATAFSSLVNTAFKNEYSGYQIILTGHSLGGMVAEYWTNLLISSGKSNVIGIGFGSPGIYRDIYHGDGKFYHITRIEDAIGTTYPDDHIGPSLYLEDRGIAQIDTDEPGLAHNHWRYEEQITEIASSPLAPYLSFAHKFQFLDDYQSNYGNADALYNVFFGSEFVDTMFALAGRSLWAEGEDGNDALYGSSMQDLLSGGTGSDRLVGNGGDDILWGGLNSDELYGDAGHDQLFGSDQNDQLYGGEGNDTLNGGNGNDTLKGGRGRDELDGGLGSDTAFFDGFSTSYQITTNTKGEVVVRNTVSGETDYLIRVDFLHFDDKWDSIDIFTHGSPPTSPPLPPGPPPVPPAPPPPATDDYGDTRGTAATAAMNSIFFGAIETSGDRDWFAFTLTKGATYGFAMTGVSNGGRSALPDGHLYLYDSSGDLIDDTNGTLTSLINYKAESSGAYYLRVRSHSDGATGAYVVSLAENAPPPEEDEPENQPVRLDLDAVESILPENDGVLEFKVEYTGDLTDNIVIAWEVNGINDHPTDASDFVHTSGTVTLRSTRDYVYIRVNPTEDQIDEADEDFELTIRIVSGNATIRDDDATGTIVNDDAGRIHPNIDEHGNSFDSATVIVEESWNRGFITTAGDVDYFAIHLTAGATYRLALYGDDDTSLIHDDDEEESGFIRLQDPQASLYDKYFNLITDRFEEHNNQRHSEFEFSPTESGTYYIAVREDGDNDIGQYFLDAQIRIPADDYKGDATTSAVLTEGNFGVAWNEREGDDDWFKIDLVAGQSYSLFAIIQQHAVSGQYVWPGWIAEYEVRVLDTNGSVVAVSAHDNILTQSNQVTYTPTESGQYFLSVQTSSNPSYPGYRYIVGFDAVTPTPPGQSYVFQPGPNAGTDVYFHHVRTDGNGNINSADNDVLRVGGADGSSGSALYFDLVGTPAEAEAAYVDIYLFGVEYNGQTGVIPESIVLGIPGASWNELAVFTDLGTIRTLSWLSAPAGTGWYRIDITGLYNQWQDGSLANNGLLLLPSDFMTVADLFYSSDYMIDPSLRPKLIVYERAPNEILGTPGFDPLYGTAKADVIRALAGDDLISAGNGNDLIHGDGGADFINGGDGFDTVSYSYSAGGVYVNLATNEAFGGDATGDHLLNIENISGSPFADTLIGDISANVLDGGKGGDKLEGGRGNDSYHVDHLTDVVKENSGEGIDTVFASISYTLSANVENLTLTGSANLKAVGNLLNNALTGNSGNNILDGGPGTDILSGGLGNDTYHIQNTSDLVVEAHFEGTDTIVSSVTYSLLDRAVENLTLTGNTNLSATGNSLNNILTGNAGNNVLAGGLGNDTYYIQNTSDNVVEAHLQGTDTVISSVTYSLLGRAVENLTLTGNANLGATGNSLNNILTGNAGANLLTGGIGNDTYIVQNAGDSVVEAEGQGTDTVLSNVAFTLGAHVENLTLVGNNHVNATGNGLNNILTGNVGNNVLSGGLGNDTYYIQNIADNVVEAHLQGTDTISSTVTYSLLGRAVENLILTGASPINGTGNSLNNGMTGNSGNNRLDAGGGHDLLNGGAGADTMSGGIGNDTFVVDVAGDTVTELANEGLDTVWSNQTWTLGANLEYLTLTGNAHVNATGNDLNNILTGNAGNNRLSGGLGDDTYYVQNAADNVVEAHWQGNDTIYSTVSYSLLGRAVEDLRLGGISDISATGNSLANKLVGNAGSNVLNGGGGNDTLIGGLGSDIFLFQAGSGADRINDFNAGQSDTIDIHAFTNGTVSAGLVTQNGSNTLINLGGGNVITVINAFATDVMAQMVW